MNLKTLAVATLLLGATVLPLTALAQQGGGGQQRGGGGFGQRGGMGQMQNSKANLVARSDVRKDIKTTAEQNTKLDALQKEYREKLQAAFQNMGGGQRNGGGGGNGGGERPDMTEIQKQMTEMNKTYEENVLKVLDEGQSKRLGQIALQMQGNRALMDSKLQTELKFTVDQKRKMDDLQASMDAANQAIFQRVQNGEIERTEVQPLMAENTKILDAELAKVLTADQTKAFEAMKGDKFTRDPKVDEEMRNQMGGRRGGGGGGGN